MANPRDESKLPVWAQKELHLLRMRLREEQRRSEAYRAAREGGEATNTLLIDYAGEKEFPLGNDARVQFALSADQYIEAWLTGTHTSGHGPRRLRVQARYGTLQIEPSAANSINIKTDRDE